MRDSHVKAQKLMDRYNYYMDKFHAIKAEHGEKHPSAQQALAKALRNAHARLEHFGNITARGEGHPASMSPEGEAYLRNK